MKRTALDLAYLDAVSVLVHLELVHLTIFFVPDAEQLTLEVPDEVFVAAEHGALAAVLGLDHLFDLERVIAPFVIERVEHQRTVGFGLLLSLVKRCWEDDVLLDLKALPFGLLPSFILDPRVLLMRRRVLLSVQLYLLQLRSFQRRLEHYKNNNLNQLSPSSLICPSISCV